VDLTQAWTAGKDQGTRQMTSAQTGSGNREEAPAGVPTVTRRIASCDLGKAAAKFVTGTVDVRGRVAIEKAESVTHDGLPLEAFREWYRRADIASCAVLGATGLHADELAAPAIAGLPEDACLLAALHQRPDLAGPLNLVRVGARGYAVLTRDAGGRVQFLENDKCSSGTGETMVKIAGRFGFSIEEADGLAQAAQEAIPITARCSVFAKSEMTHFGNQGRPADALFRGYFTSIAGYVSALLARTRVDGPILLVGGCTRILSLVDALRDALGDEVSVPEDALHFEAIGATLLAAEQCAAGTLDALPTDPADLIRPAQRRFRSLAAPADAAHHVRRLEAPPVPPGAEHEPAILGLDLGSTGSKAVLTSVASGEAILDVYDTTRGNPVDAARRLIQAVLERTRPDVRALGLTGSGREAAATVLRAAFPGSVDRILVQNEIVAHATAAIRCDDAAGESLSVVEIGGQDAKFIQIAGGQIVESDMNKACSAGTGSFLEEQGAFFGIGSIQEFTDLAQQARRPPELGQMCTVHVAEAAAEASNEGFEIPELFGGFQYSVIQNYIDRVMGQRTFARRIFFQGKPATGPALAWTLAQVTGREVVVPPNPGAMGAWGIGLCARDEFGAGSLEKTPALDLGSALGARVVERSEFQCRDRGCATLCSIEKTSVEVAGTRQTVHSGGACPKYEISTAARPKLPREAPSAFDERDRLLAPYLRDHDGERTVALPLTGACHGVFPWLATFVRELGLGVRVLRADSTSLSRGEERCYTFDACAPVKIAHGIADGEAETLLFPKILTLNDRDGSSGRTCTMEQSLPEMLREALRAQGHATRVVHPLLSFEAGFESPELRRQARRAARMLGAGTRRLRTALLRAADAQRRYEADLASVGEATLAYGRRHGIPVVAVCGSLHVIHDRNVNAGIPRLLRDNGVLPLPMDCFPIQPDVHPMPRIFWAEASRELRTAVACRARGDAYPLLLTSFGCGPGSFTEQIYAALMDGYPHTALETDAHGGTAGYVTRVQAFLHAVRQHDGRPSPAPPERLRLVEPLPRLPVEQAKQGRIVFPPLGEWLSPMRAAVTRSFGFDAVAAGPASGEALALAKRDCSGKECLAYQVLWGSSRKYLEDHPSDKPSYLMQANGEGMCRFCLYSIKDQMSLERLDLGQEVAVHHGMSGRFEDPMLGFRKTYAATLTEDILVQLTAYHRPLEQQPGQCDELYERYCGEAEVLLEDPTHRAPDGTPVVDALAALNRRAAGEFAALARRAPADPARRTVFLAGDFYIKAVPVANDFVIQRLNDRGLQVIVEPIGVMMEYLAEERLSDLFGLPSGWLANKLVKRGMRKLTREFYGGVRKQHPWLPVTDIRGVLREAQKHVDRHPQGETPVIVGSALHAWHEGLCDGVVLINGWGCSPALASESVLRHQTDVPMLFVYSDGTPIDERRLNAFAFRLRRSPALVSASPTAAHAPG
jgi:activator of 2-hydroxyglutaryl-CoA dehydratase/predicted nucleotide-binding protein (sugar kinase/HSP70/actin superfamily)